MGKFRIVGGNKLQGSIVPQGAKNEAMQIICAAINGNFSAGALHIIMTAKPFHFSVFSKDKHPWTSSHDIFTNGIMYILDCVSVKTHVFFTIIFFFYIVHFL